MACAAQTAATFEVRVGDETVPPGGLVQLKMSLTDPRPISIGKVFMDALDPNFFADVSGVALFSSSADVAGAALVQGGPQGLQVSARFTSGHGTFGTDPDYPLMTIVVGTKPVAVGTKTVVTINPGGSFWASLGLNYPATVIPGTITAGGTLSVFNVVPGGGLLPAGFVVKLIGTGFDANTKVQVDTLNPPTAQFVSSTEIDLKLTQPMDMQGARIRVTNKDGSQVTYFSYLRATTPLGNSSRGLLPFTVPIFSTAAAGGILSSSQPSAPAGSYLGLALQNANQSAVRVSLDLLSANGQVLNQAPVLLPSGARYVREMAELFGLATVPPGSGVRVTPDVPIQMLGLIGDDVASTVTPVSLSASGPPAAQVTAVPVSLHFDHLIGDSAPSGQSISLAASVAAIPFTVALSPPSSWLTVSPVAGTAPASLAVTTNVAGLTAGNYTTAINVTTSLGIEASIPVTLTVTDQITPVITAIVNAANLQAGAVSPGEIITVFGNFPGVPATGLALDSSGKVATSLARVRLLFDGFPAPLTFASSTQINAVIPYEISGSGSTRVQAQLGAVSSQLLTQSATAAAPAIFTAKSSGFGPAAALNQDNSLNNISSPAARLSVISIYATGEGRTSPPSVTGGVTATDLKNPVLPVTATIGGQTARVFYAGSAPGLVAGAMQVNIEVPANVTPGSAVEVIVKAGAAASQAGVTIAVR